MRIRVWATVEVNVELDDIALAMVNSKYMEERAIQQATKELLRLWNTTPPTINVTRIP